MRIAIGHLNHEVTIFSPLRTTLEDCRPIYFELGQGVLELHRGRFTEVSGMIEAAEQEGVTLIPTLTAQALPGGPFTDETWAYLKGEILSRIAAAGDIDGVLLALHGAASTESLDCAEADLCAAVRRQIGPDLPRCRRRTRARSGFTGRWGSASSANRRARPTTGSRPSRNTTWNAPRDGAGASTPQLTTGGHRPRPRKLSAVSPRIMRGIDRVRSTIRQLRNDVRS